MFLKCQWRKRLASTDAFTSYSKWKPGTLLCFVPGKRNLIQGVLVTPEGMIKCVEHTLIRVVPIDLGHRST